MRNKRRLTGEQENARIQGLRLLARIIARHYLDHPELYPTPAGGGADGDFVSIGMDETNVNAAVHVDGDTARNKEATQ